MPSTAPDALHALWLTLLVAAIAVPLNTVFGVGVSLILARHRFPGAWLLDALVDIPLALSPVVIGLALVLVYGHTGWLGNWLAARGITVIFSVPGIVMASAAVSLPYVVREVLPVLQEIGTEQEQAARTLGARPLTVFRRITLPNIRRGLAYGVTLTTARVLGEFGAVAIVSGAIAGKTQTLTLFISDQHRQPRPAERVRGSRGAVPRRADRPAPPHPLGPQPRRVARKGSRMSIHVDSISKRFGDAVALDDVSLEVPTGSLTALLGPSGGGKSTLLRIIAGLDTADTGTVRIEGEDLTKTPARSRGVGFCFQHYAPFRHLTVRRNVAFGLEIRRRPKAEIKARVDELLELVGLAHLGERYPSQLSGGQRQRMALARALAIEPKVLLLDEPFGALDAQVRTQLRQWLRDLHDTLHVTTVLVTHDQEEAMEVADRLAIINHGRLEQVGTPGRHVRPPGQRVRADVPRARPPASTASGCGPTTSPSTATPRPHHPTGRSRAPSPGSPTSASRSRSTSRWPTGAARTVGSSSAGAPRPTSASSPASGCGWCRARALSPSSGAWASSRRGSRCRTRRGC